MLFRKNGRPVRKTAVVWFALLAALFAGCAGQPNDIPALAVDQGLMEYLGMTYQDFLEQGGGEAQPYHANYFTAQIPDCGVTAVFASSRFDEELNVTGLDGKDPLIRHQGSLGELLDGLTEELPLETFAEGFASDGSGPEYQVEEGGGTAYYVAERYAAVTIDGGEDHAGPVMLQITLDQSEAVGPDSYAWLTW